MVRSKVDITGDLYFSKLQWRKLRDEGRDRTFAELVDGRIVEYTELISVQMQLDEPGMGPIFADAEMVGQGMFHHFVDPQNQVWGD